MNNAPLTSVSQDPVVVIGTGFGGLSAAVRLRAMGWPVVVLEAGPQAGGRARVFHQDGFTWDAGPTVITAPYLLDELFESVGRDRRDYFDLVPVDPFYRVRFDDGESFDYVGDEDRLLEQIRRFSPGDVDNYRRMAAHAERIFEVGYEGLADQPFDRLSEMLRIVPEMMKLESHRSVYGLVSKYIKDERLRQVFTFQPLLVGGNPFDTTSIYLLIHWLERKWGAWFAKGGTGAIVKGLTDLLTELDVDIRYNSPVAEIEVENGRAVAVRTESGERIRCAFTVSNADPSMVYSRMVGAEHRSRWTDRKVDRVKPSMSLFVGYLGASRTWPELAHHTILLGPRYKELLKDIFDRKVLADDFSLYLHAPTRTDASLAPEGHENLYVLSPVPVLDGGVDWETEGPRYFDKIIQALDSTVLPGLQDSIVARKSVDPRYFQSELRSAHGAAFGPRPVLTQSAWFRYHNRSEDVDGLYFVGAGTHPGAGVPGVLCSSKVMERVVPRPGRALALPGLVAEVAK